MLKLEQDHLQEKSPFHPLLPRPLPRAVPAGAPVQGVAVTVQAMCSFLLLHLCVCTSFLSASCGENGVCENSCSFAGPISNKTQPWDFPGSPVIKTGPSFHCKGQGFDPWLGELRSHMPFGVAKKE